MKVLISGASGFLGSWVARVLALNHDVIAVTRESSNTYKLKYIQDITIVSTADFSIEEIFEKFRPNALIVCSLLGVGNENRNNKRQSENLTHTLELGLLARKFGLSKVIGVGSQAELGPVSDLIYDHQKDNPTTLYGLNKIKMRQQYQDLFDQTETDFKWLRVFSTYGPLDDGNWLIPTLVDSISKNIRTDLTLGDQKWSYLHAYDLALAFKAVLESYSVDTVFNVGNPQTVKIKDVAVLIANEIGSPDLLNFGAIPYRSDQVMRLQPVCESLTKLGWRPTIEIEAGINQTISWLLRKESANEITSNGIQLTFNLPARP